MMHFPNSIARPPLLKIFRQLSPPRMLKKGFLKLTTWPREQWASL